MTLRIFMCCLCFFLSSLFADQNISWMTNYQNALEKSQKEGKPLLIYFTGSDWSGWGMKMKKEILDTPEFMNKISDKFVCMFVDFPLHKPLPQEEIEQNQRLKEKMEVSEYPRLVILNSDEREIVRLGYSPENGDRFADDLLLFVVKDDKLTKVLKQIDIASFLPSDLQSYYLLAQELKREKDAWKILEKGLECQDPLFFLLEKYRLLVEEGKFGSEVNSLRNQLIQLDPENQKGTRFSLALIDFQHLAGQKPLLNDPKVVVRPLEEYLSLFGEQDQDNVWQVEMMLAQFYLDYDESKVALQHAEAAYQVAPKEHKKEIQRSLDYIREQVGGGFTASK